MYINPYSNIDDGKGIWLKANFHTHAGTSGMSYWGGEDTCGAYEIDDVISLYCEAGYDILALTNHDIFIDIRGYSSKYDIILFNGFEYSRNPHMLCIDAGNIIDGKHQLAIEECRKAGGFVILSHPNFIRKEYWPLELLDGLQGYSGIEIYNSVITRLSGSPLATDTWDYLLSGGKLVWGFANDDFHRWYDLARAWNVIYSPFKKHQDIKEAIHKGCFYASTGLILREFKYEDGIIRVSADAGDTYVKDYEFIFFGKNGQILGKQHGKSGEYRLEGAEAYIRTQVVSEHGAMLWTQPVYKEEFYKPEELIMEDINRNELVQH